jgi:iron complex transport system substrate-binding protein
MRGLLFLGLLLTASTVAVAAERVVALSPHLAELTCAAGGCEKLVGKVAYSDYPAELAQLPSVGDAFNLNLERLLSLRPDLIITWDGGGAQQSAVRLRQLGLRVEPVGVSRLEDIAGALRRIGGWLGTAEAADDAARQFLARLQNLRARHAGARRLRVFYQAQAEPLFTVSGDSPISEAIALCGGDNVFSELGSLAAPVSLEAVLAGQVDVVIYAKQDAAATLAFWVRHPQLPAVQAKKLYAVNADLLERATPRMIEGIAELCEVLEQARR